MMGLGRYLVHDFFTARELNRVEEQIKNVRRSNQSRINDLRAAQAEMEQLEMDLGRAYLMIGALTEICVRKKVFSSEELTEIMNEIDIRDGSADGRVTPNPERKSAENLSTSQFLRQLEQEG